MTPRIITYFLCGMRHPTTGLSEDDLSRLTGSSSSTSSSSSSSSTASLASEHHKDIINDDQQKHVIHPLHTQTHHITGSPERMSQQQHHKNHLNILHNETGNGGGGGGGGGGGNGATPSATTPRFSSTYLPEIINPLEWQKSRKRKERQDSTSSASAQERKLQRSNSEELLSEAANVTLTAAATAAAARIPAVEIMRRVSSEDFKRNVYVHDISDHETSAEATVVDAANLRNNTKEKSPIGDENNGSLANLQQQQQQQQQQQTRQHHHKRQQQQTESALPLSGEVTKDLTCRTRYETSPARSHRHSPVRGNGRHRDSDDSECEHERRRSSERFCKSRQPPGRKAAGVTKKSGSTGVKYLPTKRGDEGLYKYDLSALKYERRGFISKKTTEKVIEKPSASAGSDHNDNNLQLDFHQSKNNNSRNNISPTPTTCSSTGSEDNTLTTSVNTAATTQSSKKHSKVFASAQESLPWERPSTNEEEPAPVLSRRYAHSRLHEGESIDTAAKLAKVMPYPQPAHKQVATAQLLGDEMGCLEPFEAARAFSSLENIRTRDVMQQVLPAMMAFQTPEERLKMVNRRITVLKKKLNQLEEALETRLGYRPSQAERLNDKYMKNFMAELSKLRKERHELKADPIAALGLKVSGGMDAVKKLEQMRSSLIEIEENLSEKRKDGQRDESLEDLTPAQLVQEKTAVQHGLLYFESQYGRPITKDERDAARPLYERYRQLKRLVSRTNLFSGIGGAGAPDLPTILEHEAMVFEATPLQYSSNNSTDTTNSPSESLAPNTLTTSSTNASSDESTTTTTTTTTAATREENNDADTGAGASGPPADNENIRAFSLAELWEQLDRVREEKKVLKETIREYESIFEEQNGRKMLKNDRRAIETYAQYKEKKAKTRLLQALIKKHISR